MDSNGWWHMRKRIYSILAAFLCLGSCAPPHREGDIRSWEEDVERKTLLASTPSLELVYVAINTTATGTTPAPDGVTLLNESVTMSGFKGDRTVVSDAVRVRNNCSYPIVVSLKAEPQFGSVSSTGLTNMAVDVYLGKRNAGASGTDFSLTADWDGAPIHYNSTGASSAATGTVTIPAAEDRQIGYRLDVGTTATGTGTIRYTVSAQA